MNRRNRKEIVKKTVENIKRAVKENSFKINGKVYAPTKSSQEILEELRKKGYLSGSEALRKALPEPWANQPILHKNARQKQGLPLADYLF